MCILNGGSVNLVVVGNSAKVVSRCFDAVKTSDFFPVIISVVAMGIDDCCVELVDVICSSHFCYLLFITLLRISMVI